MAVGVQVSSTLDSRTRSEVEAEVIADYRASSPRSTALHEAARRVIPGGDTRTVAFHAPYPLVITEGRGCRIHDADGRTYVDLLNNYTSLIHGHAHPAVIAAVSERLPYGTAFPAPNEDQTRLAEIIVDRVASVDMVRFCKSGSEHAPFGVLNSRGVPANTTDNVVVTPLSDIDAVERLILERGQEVAAVI